MIRVSRGPSRASPICQMVLVVKANAAVPNAPTSSLDNPSSARPGRLARTMPASSRSVPVMREDTNPISPSSAWSTTRRTGRDALHQPSDPFLPGRDRSSTRAVAEALDQTEHGGARRSDLSEAERGQRDETGATAQRVSARPAAAARRAGAGRSGRS